MRWPGVIPLLSKILGFDDVFERPIACQVCKRRLRSVAADLGNRVQVCPKWHSAVIEVQARDVRSSRSLVEAAPNIRAVKVDDE